MNTPDDPRWITLRVSRINLAITCCGAAATFPLLFLVPISPAVRTLLLLVFALAMVFDLVLTLLWLPQSVVAFHLVDIDRAPPMISSGPRDTRAPLGVCVRFRGHAGQTTSTERDGTVLAGNFVTPWFTALRYRLPGDPAWRRLWPRVIPLWSDSVGSDDFRRTRVALKWK
jgi:hypothetical protein